MRILVADDEASVRHFIRVILAAAGFEVLEAVDGLEALEILRGLRGDVQLLVTDIRMPRMDGITLASAIAEQYPGIPILYISGYSFDFDQQQQKLASHRCGFVPKPFLPKPFLEAVRKCLGEPKQVVTAAS